ncbi:DUF1833 family protein [Stutzerimonas frequens]|uniref:DUF1833 family protein n=1 Tax=Stutzerimonas frequens TaxID=2968969 RepID=UPI0019091B90|nr:DUF1833 family protein [Stutzerimonas frequens]MBK3872131.1 DUF1833 domain-containing protein [Stutzerimonas frequens]MBK3910662.1 DUF1833 domain-containing protein [Stutzerimonas frequens]MBK3929923.1 DUF1833 domain-containing protein [Stutzerimonas frequens]
MTVLEQVYASGGDVLIFTLELTCEAWDEPILLCQGFEDQACITEDGRELTFMASGIALALPKKTSSGAQNLTFAIDNVTGEAQRKIDAALEAEKKVFITLRTYLDSDRTAPAENPYRAVVLGGKIKGASVQITAGFFDVINTAFPRDLYTVNFAPGIRYL